MAKKEATLIIRIKEMASESLDKIQGGLEGIAKGAAIAFAAFSAVIAKSISDLREEEKATQQLNQAMINAGVYTEKLADKYSDLASALQQNSLYGDEQIKQAQAIMQAHIGNMEVTEDLMKATLDLAAAKGIDLASAADLVGKTIGTDTNALKRNGIEIDENLNKNQKLSAVIGEITKKYDGQAEAQTKGLGSLTKMKNAFSDLMETLGAKFAPMIEKVSNYLTKMFNFISNNQPIMSFIAAIVAGGAALSGFITVVAGLGAALLAANAAALAMGISMTALLGPIGLIAAGITAVGAAIGYYLTQAGEAETATAKLKDEIKDTERELSNAQARMNQADMGSAQRALHLADVEKWTQKLIELRVKEHDAAVNTEASKNEKLAQQNQEHHVKITEQDIAAEQAKLDRKLAFDNIMLNQELISNQLEKDMLTANEAEKEILKSEAEIKRLETVLAHNDALIQAETNKEAKLALIRDNAELRKTTNQKKSTLSELQLEDAKNKAKEASLQSSLGIIAGMQGSSNQALAVAGKAAALTQIALETPVAVSKALSAAPPPFNFALAAGVGAAMAQQTAKVLGVPLAEGGIVMPRPGGTQATIGEAGQAEAVIPLDRAGEFGLGGGGGTNVTINVQGGLMGSESEAREFALAIDKELLKLRRNNESVSFDRGVV